MKIGKFFAWKLSFTKSMNYFSYEPIVFNKKRAKVQAGFYILKCIPDG